MRIKFNIIESLKYNRLDESEDIFAYLFILMKMLLFTVIDY